MWSRMQRLGPLHADARQYQMRTSVTRSGCWVTEAEMLLFRSACQHLIKRAAVWAVGEGGRERQ